VTEELKEMLQGMTVEELEQLKKHIPKIIEEKQYDINISRVYWYIRSDGTILETSWLNDQTDHKFYALGNCFKSQETAEMARDKVKSILLEMRGK
jgi:hypothetical protein